MMQNFTTIDENAEEATINEECKNEIAQSFEEKVKKGIETLAKTPSSQTIENILNYSKSLKN